MEPTSATSPITAPAPALTGGAPAGDGQQRGGEQGDRPETRVSRPSGPGSALSPVQAGIREPTVVWTSPAAIARTAPTTSSGRGGRAPGHGRTTALTGRRGVRRAAWSAMPTRNAASGSAPAGRSGASAAGERRGPTQLPLAVDAFGDLVHVVQRDAVTGRRQVDPLQRPTAGELGAAVGGVVHEQHAVGGGGGGVDLARSDGPRTRHPWCARPPASAWRASAPAGGGPGRRASARHGGVGWRRRRTGTRRTHRATAARRR